MNVQRKEIHEVFDFEIPKLQTFEQWILYGTLCPYKLSTHKMCTNQWPFFNAFS